MWKSMLSKQIPFCNQSIADIPKFKRKTRATNANISQGFQAHPCINMSHMPYLLRVALGRRNWNLRRFHLSDGLWASKTHACCPQQMTWKRTERHVLNACWMGSQVEKPQSLPEEVVASFGKVGETNPQSQNIKSILELDWQKLKTEAKASTDEANNSTTYNL